MFFCQFKIGRKSIDNVFFTITFGDKVKISDISKNIRTFHSKRGNIQVHFSGVQPSACFTRMIFINNTCHSVNQINFHPHFKGLFIWISRFPISEIIHITNKITDAVPFVSDDSDDRIYNNCLIEFYISGVECQRKPVRRHPKFFCFYKIIILVIFQRQSFYGDITQEININIFNPHSHFKVIVQHINGLIGNVPFCNRKINSDQYQYDKTENCEKYIADNPEEKRAFLLADRLVSFWIFVICIFIF